MGKSVLRVGESGEITHIKTCHNTYLSVNDDKTFRGHTITVKDMQNHYGEDDRHVLRTELLLIVNEDYNTAKMKFDIMESGGYFKDPILTGNE